MDIAGHLNFSMKFDVLLIEMLAKIKNRLFNKCRNGSERRMPGSAN